MGHPILRLFWQELNAVWTIHSSWGGFRLGPEQLNTSLLQNKSSKELRLRVVLVHSRLWNGVYHKPSKHLLLYPLRLRVIDSALCSAKEKAPPSYQEDVLLSELIDCTSNLWGSVENGNMKTFVKKLRVSEEWAQNVKINMRPSKWRTLCDWAGYMLMGCWEVH